MGAFLLGFIMDVEEWGKELGKIIGRTENRVANYKKTIQTAYKNDNRELIKILKEIKNDEEKFLKKLRREKTFLNAGCWEYCLFRSSNEE